MKYSKRVKSKIKAQRRSYYKKYESYRSRVRYKTRNPPAGTQFRFNF